MKLHVSAYNDHHQVSTMIKKSIIITKLYVSAYNGHHQVSTPIKKSLYICDIRVYRLFLIVVETR